MFSLEIIKLLKRISRQLEDIALAQDRLKLQIDQLHSKLKDFHKCSQIIEAIELPQHTRTMLN